MTQVSVKRASSERGWEIVKFTGPTNCESTGIVDLLAIRKDHTADPRRKRGDFFELILIQVKGGSATEPSLDDIRRLRQVAERYGARDVILAEWTRGKASRFRKLRARSSPGQSDWNSIDDLDEVFA